MEPNILAAFDFIYYGVLPSLKIAPENWGRVSKQEKEQHLREIVKEESHELIPLILEVLNATVDKSKSAKEAYGLLGNKLIEMDGQIGVEYGFNFLN